MADPFANAPGEGVPAATFLALFDGMPDIYNGTYQPLLAEYTANDQIDSVELMRRTLTRLPADRIPAVFIYQDAFATIRSVHHIHQVEATFGQPDNPLTNSYLGFNGDVYNGTAQLVKLSAETFFSNTGDTRVLTPVALTAQIVAAANGMIAPLNANDPDTEVVNTRRAVPIPHAYRHLVTFRTLSPLQAWQQIGQQIILDGREQDCMILLNFLRVATVMTRAGRNQPHTMPVTIQPAGIWPPIDGPILEHTHRRLRQLLPGLQAAPVHAQAAPFAQTVALVTQTVADGIDALRADRLLEREAAATPKSFSEVFPANAVGIRQLCLAGNDDDMLPEFWRFLATVKGKKGPGMSAFINYVTTRANNTARIKPIVSTALYINISAFELGASDLEIITQGVSPFLMCPAGYRKAQATTLLTQQYMLLQGEHNLPLLGDIQQLIPSNDYSIPDDIHTLANFVGAYCVVWEVLVGENHPLSAALRAHHTFWKDNVDLVITAIPEPFLQNVVIVGTLRYMQLSVLRYVNLMMYSEHGQIPTPDFTYVESAIHGRLFQTLPSLPATYLRTPATATSAAPAVQLPPVVLQTPTPPNRRPTTTGTQVTAPSSERTQALLDAFAAQNKTIQQLRNLPNQPKVRRGNTNLCLSYHFRGQCFDSCRKIATHRRLEPIEVTNLQTFLAANN